VNPIPAVSFIGVSGSGKTTLLERLLPALARRGLRVVAVTHTHHVRLAPERPDRDTARLLAAGAVAVAGVAGGGDGWDTEVFEQTLAGLPDSDVVLVEGWRALRLPAVEVVGPDGSRHPPAAFGPVLCVASAVPVESGEPVHSRDDPEGLADRLTALLSLGPGG
jgi:molybdopterin-guanine dinucleotide biosynthesis protein B